jgi:salicylate hydroxylase
MKQPELRVAIVGAGIGGTAAALALSRIGIDVTVFEQAGRISPLGSAITMTPNAVRVLDGLGLGRMIRETGYRPAVRLNRAWDSGSTISRIELGDASERKFGFPLLTFHRADLLGILQSALRPDVIRLGKKLVALREQEAYVELRFSDETTAVADIVIGADGIHSTVREILFGAESPRFTGIVGVRALVAAARLPGIDVTPFTKWWGPERASQLVTTPIRGGDELYVFGSFAQDEWRQESWSIRSDVSELKERFSGYADEARSIVNACEETLKTAIYERDPLPRWTAGHITLLGDACHPMTPFMAQGGAMAIEDAAILSRCLSGASSSSVQQALKSYELVRRERTAHMQLSSHDNNWARNAALDMDAVYGFDAWTVPLLDRPATTS